MVFAALEEGCSVALKTYRRAMEDEVPPSWTSDVAMQRCSSPRNKKRPVANGNTRLKMVKRLVDFFFVLRTKRCNTFPCQTARNILAFYTAENAPSIGVADG